MEEEKAGKGVWRWGERETVGTIRDGEPRTSTPSFTHLLSSVQRECADELHPLSRDPKEHRRRVASLKKGESSTYLQLKRILNRTG